MKFLIETTGDFMLYDVLNMQCVESDRPSVVADGPFLQAQMGLKNVRILIPDLPDEATDAEWVDWLKASEAVDLAVASYREKYHPEPEPKKGKKAEA